jgi:hypothetical protein
MRSAAHPFSFLLAACCPDARPGGGGLAALLADSFWLVLVVSLAVALTWAAARVADADPGEIDRP